MAFKLNHLHLKTRDPQGTARFYEEVFGARITRQSPRGGFHLDLHGLELNVSTFVPTQAREQKYGMEHVSIYTDEYDRVRALLAARGVKILEELKADGPQGKRCVFFEGPDGVQLEFIEKKL